MGLFGNMINNYFYGKAGKGDYRIEDMPQNRFQLFGEVLKVRWSAMIGVNLLYIVSWLPAAAWTIINLMMLTSAEAQDALGYLSMYLLILAPCIAITGPFSAGIAYVMRNWARDQHSFVWSDFWDAVKANWKQALLVSVISGVAPVVLYFGWQFYGSMAAKSLLFYIPMGLVLMMFVVWKLMEMVIYTMMVTYDLKFKDLLRNSFLLTIGKLPLAVGVKLLTLVVPILAIAAIFVIPGAEPYVMLIFAVLYLLFMPAFPLLAMSLFAVDLLVIYALIQYGGRAHSHA